MVRTESLALICSRNPQDIRCLGPLREIAIGGGGGGGGGVARRAMISQEDGVRSRTINEKAPAVIVPPDLDGEAKKVKFADGEVPPTFTGGGPGLASSANDLPPTLGNELIPPTLGRTEAFSRLSTVNSTQFSGLPTAASRNSFRPGPSEGARTTALSEDETRFLGIGRPGGIIDDDFTTVFASTGPPRLTALTGLTGPPLEGSAGLSSMGTFGRSSALEGIPAPFGGHSLSRTSMFDRLRSDSIPNLDYRPGDLPENIGMNVNRSRTLEDIGSVGPPEGSLRARPTFGGRGPPLEGTAGERFAPAAAEGALGEQEVGETATTVARAFPLVQEAAAPIAETAATTDVVGDLLAAVVL